VKSSANGSHHDPWNNAHWYETSADDGAPVWSSDLTHL
jgi:hypothetical protein